MSDKLQADDSGENKQTKPKEKRFSFVAAEAEVFWEIAANVFSLLAWVDTACNSNSDPLACYPHTTARKTLPR